MTFEATRDPGSPIPALFAGSVFDQTTGEKQGVGLNRKAQTTLMTIMTLSS